MLTGTSPGGRITRPMVSHTVTSVKPSRTYDESVSDTIVNTVEISSDISNAMFEIPDDYTVTDTR